MTPLQAAVLGVVQGLTEFLPVSSSAHLFVVPALLGWHYEGVAFDVALHVGTLAALLLAFAHVWWKLLRDAVSRDGATRAAAWDTWAKLAIGSVPAAIAGLLLKDAAETQLRWLPLQAITLFVFGFLLWWVDRAAPTRPGQGTPSWGASILVGLAQPLSLIPGVSRSGVTITAGRAVGLDRVRAAQFSFLLATPITFGAALLEFRHVSPDMPKSVLATGIVTSAVVGVIAIKGLLRWLGRAGFGAFFAYRALLALVILVHVFRHER
jgi:undecaprenyl-diphosphatase